MKIIRVSIEKIIKALTEAVKNFQQSWELRHAGLSLVKENSIQKNSTRLFGHFWSPFQYLAFIAVITLIFQRGQNVETTYYVAYVAMGLFVWLPIMQALSSGASIFSQGKFEAHGVLLPISLSVLNRTWETFIEFMYLSPFCLILLFATGHWPQIDWLWMLPSLLLIAAALPAMITILGTVCVINSAIQLIVQRILGILMFLTPIFWIPRDGGSGRRAMLRNILDDWNPLSHYLRIVRNPVVDGEFPVLSFGICTTLTLCLWLSALILFGSLQKKIMSPR